MAKFTTILESLYVAAPCKADWNEMLGDNRVRFCGQCQKNVYNLSNMSRKEAERLVTNREGGMCVRFYKRRDGTVITTNCPVGLREIKRRVSRISVAMISALLSFVTGISAYSKFNVVEVDSSEIPSQTLQVYPLLIIENVDEVTGKIDVDNDVIINGSVSLHKASD